jgi:methionyl aminopeptidase
VIESPLQQILETLASMVRIGMTTLELDNMADLLLRAHKVDSAFRGYGEERDERGSSMRAGFPNVSCISVNNEVIHGIPSDYKIQDGDVVKIDLGLRTTYDEDGYIKNFYDDGATTVIAGNGSSMARRLVKATREALEKGITQAKAGHTTHDIARAVASVAIREGFGIIKGYGGHGIGTQLHMEPHVPNEVLGPAVKLESGQRICIEPMFCTKKGFVETASNGWTVKLVGGGVAAHFEKSVLIA